MRWASHAAIQKFVDANVKYDNWDFFIGLDDGQTPYLQIKLVAPDNAKAKSKAKSWSGRKWRLSFHMTASEIVLTCFKAVMTALEHEAREKFRYRGRAILGPHIDVDALWGVCDILDERE